MTTLKVALLTMLLTGVAAAQNPLDQPPAPDVTVLKVSWRHVKPGNPRLNEARGVTSADAAQRMAVNTARINENNSARSGGAQPTPPVLIPIPSVQDSPPIVRPWSGFIYEFVVKNTGSKTIKQVVFEQAFTDPSTQKKIARRQYKSKVKIRPGTTAKLVVRSSLRPIGTIDATRAGQDLHEQSPDDVVVQKIKYADGSVWERAAQ